MTEQITRSTDTNTPYETTVNFMGGTSFKLNPLQTLRIVSTSMICGESMYYRATQTKWFYNDDSIYSKAQLTDYTLFPDVYSVVEESSEDYFMQIVNKALEYDYAGTLLFIGRLRNDYYMRLNSHVLIVSAIHHPSRVNFNIHHPNKMKDAIRSACLIPTDWTTQFQLLKATKRPIPTIWKKTIAGMLEIMTAYQASKYIHGSKSGNMNDTTQNTVNMHHTKQHAKNRRNDKSYYPKRAHLPNMVSLRTPKTSNKMSLSNLVDLVRITHPKSTPVIKELIQTGKVKVSNDAQTWEKLRSANKTWFEITEQIRMPHMALLRNLKNISNEFETVIDDKTIMPDVRDKYMTRATELAALLVSGVKTGKQFPFRYYSAYKMLQSTDAVIIAGIFVLALEDCILVSLDTIPEIKGRVDCLTDNSGSSRNSMVSEYGTINIYEIANLSSILTAYRSTEGGSVWIFGDRLQEYPVSHEKRILTQLDEVNQIGYDIGQNSETGVWLFWDMVIRANKKLDTVFIYSDMQAGHGDLYASYEHHTRLYEREAQLTCTGHIDVLRLVKVYRELVYSKVNVFSVQVAGYDNSIMPDILYRGAILSGWTGKEAKMAYEMIRVWDEVEFAYETTPDLNCGIPGETTLGVS